MLKALDKIYVTNQFIHDKIDYFYTLFYLLLLSFLAHILCITNSENQISLQLDTRLPLNECPSNCKRFL